MVQSVSLEQLRKDAVDIFHNGLRLLRVRNLLYS